MPETKWVPFYLHEQGLLSEHEHWSNEGCDSFEDSPWMRGKLQYATPKLVENTEICGPIALDAGPDAAQEALLQIFRDLGSLRNPEALRGWVLSSRT